MEQAIIDHDLLVELKTEMRAVRADIKELKDNVAKRVEVLEDEKINRDEVLRYKTTADEAHHDFETRIRFLERYCWLAIGALAIIEIVFRFFVK